MSTATDMLESYIAAEMAVLKGLSFRTPEGRQLTRANLQEIIAGRKQWERRVARERAAASGSEGGYAVADFGGCR